LAIHCSMVSRFVKTPPSCPASSESKRKTAFRLEVKEVYQTHEKQGAADEELIDVLIAISVVSKRLARNLTLVRQTKPINGRRKNR
jgi:acetyl-CoA carboxylase carboxyltransferase component